MYLSKFVTYNFISGKYYFSYNAINKYGFIVAGDCLCKTFTKWFHRVFRVMNIFLSTELNTLSNDILYVQ